MTVKSGRRGSYWLDRHPRYWMVAGMAGAVLLAGMTVIVATLRALEQERIREYSALADKISKSAMTMLIHENYSQLQDLVDLLTNMSSVQYLAVYVGEETGICGGDPRDLQPRLLALKDLEGEHMLAGATGRYLAVNHPLPFNSDLFAAPNVVQTVFRLDPWFTSRNNMLIAVGMILLLVLLLGFDTWLLQRARRQLKQAEKNKRQMISGLTHHAIKFITVIQGQIFKNQMRLQAGVPVAPETLSQDLRVAAQNIDALNRLVENLNDHESLGNFAVRLLPAALSLRDKITEAVENLQDLAARREITLECANLYDALDVTSDAHVIRQVLINVLHNAVQYSPVRGAVKIWQASDAGQVTIYISDQGPGVKPEDWDRIFVPFTRLIPDVRGTGLGLSNSRRLIRLIGGELGVQASHPGRGTTFFIRIPRQFRDGGEKS